MKGCTTRALVNGNTYRTLAYEEIDSRRAIVRLSLLSFTQAQIIATGSGASVVCHHLLLLLLLLTQVFLQCILIIILLTNIAWHWLERFLITVLLSIKHTCAATYLHTHCNSTR